MGQILPAPIFNTEYGILLRGHVEVFMYSNGLSSHEISCGWWIVSVELKGFLDGAVASEWAELALEDSGADGTGQSGPKLSYIISSSWYFTYNFSISFTLGLLDAIVLIFMLTVIAAVNTPNI